MRFRPASFIRLIVNLRFAQNGTKTCHSTGKTLACSLSLYDYAKITTIHPVINAQLHGIFCYLFFDTPCTVYIYIYTVHDTPCTIKSKSAFTTNKYTSLYILDDSIVQTVLGGVRVSFCMPQLN